jgi:radical SAM superfamily enzyme YgiQ (UPF0313 family)
MRALCIQPPFTQLNAPYPAVWYLDAWFRSRGIASSAEDHAIALTRSLYSREGLGKAFAAARVALTGRKHPDKASEKRVAAYLAQEDRYLALIDGLAGYLAGQDPAFSYRLAVGAGLPLGMRAEAVLGEEGGIVPEDAPALATAVINDLADFIAYALDPGFGAVRYAERLASGAREYAEIKAAATDSWVLNELYRPLLRRRFDAMRRDAPDAAGRDAPVDRRRDGGRRVGERPTYLICLTAPFPGCLAGALVAAEEAKAAFGSDAAVVLGGGYPSTELRYLDAPEVFDDFDYLVYDAGYAALDSLLARWDGSYDGPLLGARYRGPDGTVRAEGLEAPAASMASRAAGGEMLAPEPAPAAFAAAEARDLAVIHPDYTGCDFSAYLRVVDSPNPMHRLWNDTPWLKYRLAYGCYWRRCAFCDTELDYIKRYRPVELEPLFKAADRAASRTRLYGIHFTDEAMPAAQVLAFARLNRGRRRPFTFWGNARFDRSWTDKAVAEAAEGGLIAVSGGIEIATGRGLEIVDKGFGLAELMRSLAAFKRSGILVHAYLIYGFPGQRDQDIADSAETVRVLLSEGLIDSAFWHKFVLTRHSRLYARWEKGEVEGLEPIVPPSRFAVNDLRFKGEAGYDRWTAPLDAALAAWAERGEFDRSLASFLPKGMPHPRFDAAKALREAGI